jgi:23S rRNA (cytosine1962-C5)-methyltransferase
MRRIAAAVAYRDLVVKRRSARLVFGEADLLPGLIVDKFENHLVLQTLSVGWTGTRGSSLTP